MESAYDMYHYFLMCSIPCVFVWFLLIVTVVQAGKKIKEHTFSSEELTAIAFALCVAIVIGKVTYTELIVCNGLEFLLEKESEAMEKQGVIQTYVNSARISSHGYPKDVIIDDELYLWMSKESVSEGSYVEITYMPKSKVILRMNVLEE